MEPDAPSRWPTWWRFAFLLVPAMLFVAIFWVYLAHQADRPAPGGRAPDFTAPYLGKSGEFALASLEGKPVVLNFWASWCVPCREEAELLESAHQRYAGQVEFVGIDTRDSRTDALSFVEDYGVTYPQVIDEGERLYTLYGLTGQPESFFIDQDGIVIRHIPGALRENDLDQYVRELVNRNA
jgi:cytochrome c biogenesis protein CcmG, thiol:disulfide interchange protein DsbE